MGSTADPSEGTPRPRRRGVPEDRSEIPLTSFLPTRNPPARCAYVLAGLGLVPVLGLFLGVPAAVCGTNRSLSKPDHHV